MLRSPEIVRNFSRGTVFENASVCDVAEDILLSFSCQPHSVISPEEEEDLPRIHSERNQKQITLVREYATECETRTISRCYHRTRTSNFRRKSGRNVWKQSDIDEALNMKWCKNGT